MKKPSLQILTINSQEGVLLNGKQVIAGYSHHNKIVVFISPWKSDEVKLPKQFDGYKLANGFTDSMSLNYWTGSGRSSAFEILSALKKVEKLKKTKIKGLQV
jgi:hypothetical protein